MARQSTYKRIRSAVDKQKTKVILECIRNNWDVVLNSSVSMLKTLDFRTRFRFALDIMLGKKKRPMRAIRGERKKNPIEGPGVKEPGSASAASPKMTFEESVKNQHQAAIKKGITLAEKRMAQEQKTE